MPISLRNTLRHTTRNDDDDDDNNNNNNKKDDYNTGYWCH